VGLTVDAVGEPIVFTTLLSLLEELDVKATFFIGATLQPEIVETVFRVGHEIGSHTLSHSPSLATMSYEEKELEISRGHDALTRILSGVEGFEGINGFRAPYYNFHPDIPLILEGMGYAWDSSKAYFPILGSLFASERHGEIIELPTLHPDDHTMIRRLGLTEDQVLGIWKRSYVLSEDMFVLGIHPYICAESLERVQMLRSFLMYVQERGGRFCTLTEMSHATSA
jgi:peptidoglycan/xylan/chitin deacetylase (PgdA/CDA1 family)